MIYNEISETCENGAGCLTCNSSKNRTINGDKCDCDAGTYDNGSEE